MEPRPRLDGRFVADILLPLGVLGAIAALFWVARDALAPFALGLVIAYAIAPAVRAIERRTIAGRRAPRAAAIALIYLLIGAVIVGLIWLLLPPLLAQVRQLIASAPGYIARVQSLYSGIEAWYLALDLNPELREEINSWLAGLAATALSLAQGVGMNLLATTTRTIGFIFGLILVPFWVFYLLRDQQELGRQTLGVFPEAWQPTVRDVMVIADRVLGGYLRGQLFLMVSVGVAVLVAAVILGMTVSPTVGRYALLLGVVAGLTEVIPVIGPILGGAVGVAISVVDGPSAILWTVLAYVLIQQLENTLLVPKIMGDALELNPAILILALAVGSQIAGLAGAILAGPAVALATVLVRYAQARLRGEIAAGTVTPHTIPLLRQRCAAAGQRSA
ncbi:MAG: AI-2E family transporter [Chloroflexota bacterium]|nr:AI-2E family transporter [Dehalococcoidia bacterium]MDW8255313.1 AI-2E family transporter [Chloroflexota bacterium]